MGQPKRHKATFTATLVLRQGHHLRQRRERPFLRHAQIGQVVVALTDMTRSNLPRCPD